jgi:hypothetical protein
MSSKFLALFDYEMLLWVIAVTKPHSPIKTKAPTHKKSDRQVRVGKCHTKEPKRLRLAVKFWMRNTTEGCDEYCAKKRCTAWQEVGKKIWEIKKVVTKDLSFIGKVLGSQEVRGLGKSWEVRGFWELVRRTNAVSGKESGGDLRKP